MAEIITIHIVRKRNAVVEPYNYVTVRSNFGIVGDHRSDTFQIGQITIVEAEIIDAMSLKLGYDVPTGSSRRQIMVKGIRLNELIGQNLRLGQILVRVEDKCSPCNNMEKKIVPGAKNAMEDKGGVRCRVIAGGDLHIGDKITVETASCSYRTRISNYCFRFVSVLKRLSNKA